MTDFGDVKVYTVNGAAAGSSSSLPDWLTRKRAVKGKGRKRAIREQVEGTIELIQGFEFPEASNRVKTTRDGHHVIATGTYKPQVRVWDLDQLSLKFERHTDAENVDFVTLSDDWTKSIHLQNDRTAELHTQGGLHYRTRIPRFGRSLAYHFPSCDTYFTASGNEVYRLNLELGRFMTPLVLEDEHDEDPISGVNVVDINPAHQLLAFGVEGNGTVQFWDPRSRTNVGILRLPTSRLLPTGSLDASVSVTALSSRADGLSYAVGTSTGHTLLYDIRSPRAFATKDQGYGLPVSHVAWIEGGSRMAGDGLVLSADKKVIKIWDRNSPATNFASITPAMDLNDVHHVPGSGLLLTANEGIQMGSFFIPQLGPAPRWASFLENITEEMEDQTARSAYEDYKFVERSELRVLGLDHLVGTPALRPYMHGYFVALQLYDAARLIANPYVHAEQRERAIRDKMEKQAETRIRARKEPGVKVNKALAERVMREQEKAQKLEERRRARKAEKPVEGDVMEVDEAAEGGVGLLSDPRFSKVFEDPAFAIDVNSTEYAMLNPSSVAQKSKRRTNDSDESASGSEEEDAASDDDGASSDSSGAGELSKWDPRAHPGQRNVRADEAYARNRRQTKVKMVPLKVRGGTGPDRDASFGQRKSGAPQRRGRAPRDDAMDGGMEVSWVPSTTAADDGAPKGKGRRKGVETFGAGMERGGEEEDRTLSESEKKGRSYRRKGVRSGSKGAFRRMQG
ncbi:WD40-repeat-containing domain protein [Schizophyllum amplum]|uniref:WD40-repeat-containing domain protein n=1 Tax=Schizophyllum amplum TaxID=97359 RepID=A0A550C6K4_9AGAR|nr:WD40-repeat-containing domain protein [Auriculariopsis ampla]